MCYKYICTYLTFSEHKAVIALTVLRDSNQPTAFTVRRINKENHKIN